MFIGGRMWENTTREIKCHWMSPFKRTAKKTTKKYIKTRDDAKQNTDTKTEDEKTTRNNAWSKPLNISETDEQIV